ncbi:hypothetical protein QAD02_018331 [Eretmocerus hayati]|uniref:Uncharacterized protein n=1 Tax=Eretmocerus hayati TaxID=131215 RepID=A0ACC2PG37_9HYME|nr:hypothetical protein QAD02_018331 [Eretmocerus hayati]
MYHQFNTVVLSFMLSVVKVLALMGEGLQVEKRDGSAPHIFQYRPPSIDDYPFHAEIIYNCEKPYSSPHFGFIISKNYVLGANDPPSHLFNGDDCTHAVRFIANEQGDYTLQQKAKRIKIEEISLFELSTPIEFSLWARQIQIVGSDEGLKPGDQIQVVSFVHWSPKKQKFCVEVFIEQTSVLSGRYCKILGNDLNSKCPNRILIESRRSLGKDAGIIRDDKLIGIIDSSMGLTIDDEKKIETFINLSQYETRLRKYIGFTKML